MLTLCEQFKRNCLMNVDGKCVGLNRTDFAYDCPFFKDRFDMSTAQVEEFDRGCMNGFKLKTEEGKTLSASEINGRKKGVTW